MSPSSKQASSTKPAKSAAAILEALAGDSHLLVAGAHGFLALGNLRRGRMRWVAFHAIVGGVDLAAAVLHAMDAGRL